MGAETASETQERARILTDDYNDAKQVFYSMSDGLKDEFRKLGLEMGASALEVLTK